MECDKRIAQIDTMSSRTKNCLFHQHSWTIQSHLPITLAVVAFASLLCTHRKHNFAQHGSIHPCDILFGFVDWRICFIRCFLDHPHICHILKPGHRSIWYKCGSCFLRLFRSVENTRNNKYLKRNHFFLIILNQAVQLRVLKKYCKGTVRRTQVLVSIVGRA